MQVSIDEGHRSPAANLPNDIRIAPTGTGTLSALAVALLLTGCVNSVTPLSQEAVDELAAPGSLGGASKTYRITVVDREAEIAVPSELANVGLLQPDSMKLFRLSDQGSEWEIIEKSHFSAERKAVVARGLKSGTYRVHGASRIEDVYDLQALACSEPSARFAQIPEICKVILCPAFDPALLAAGGPDGPGAGGLPSEGFAHIGGAFGDICDQCLGRPFGPGAFPECGIPGLGKPGSPFGPGAGIPWPGKPKRPQNACVSGSYEVGQVDYDFEDEFDLIPAGAVTPAYPDVDVRATVRYPATASGTGQPVGGTGRFPLVIFLHGNHATCPCSCSHACAPGDQIKNHTGYDYLLDILASWGFIAVSIDGFDVTCAGSFAMSDYEARGRLVLRHLSKWLDWDQNGTDPWGGLFHHRVADNRIGLAGHSRGGEGVIAAEHFNRVEGAEFNIKSVVAIAPTDQDPDIHYVPQVPYLLLMASSDGDVSNLQGLRTYDRTSLQGATPQSEKSMLWIYGANHNFFNTSWTPGFGEACASDDGSGSGRISASLQRLSACQSIVLFFRLHLQNQTGFRPLFQGKALAQGLDGVELYWAYQNPERLEVDNFDAGNDPFTNSLGGAVTSSGGFTDFGEFEFKAFDPAAFNTSFRHFTRGLVLGWNGTETYETVLPPGKRDLSQYTHLSLRVGAILDAEAKNPLDTPRTLRIALRTGSGTVSNMDFQVVGLESVPYPYEYNGGKTVLTTLRVPLKIFRDGSSSLPLNDIEAVMFEFKGSGLLAIDDIQFTE